MPDLGLRTNFDVIDEKVALKGKFVIDAGCGDMSLSRRLAEKGASVLAIDPDPIQAKANQNAAVIPNVGFAETTADSLPVEPASVDGIIFSYSLHHVPKESFPAVFTEVLRVLKPDGFLYVIEPVASGDYNDVMSMFHDEERVRADAQSALNQFARPYFRQSEDFTYHVKSGYQGWEDFSEKYINSSFNSNYTAEQVREKSVQDRFEAVGAPINYQFDCPVQVSVLTGLKNAVS